MIEVPEEYAAHIRHREGDAGARWLDALPALVDELCDAWGCTVDGLPAHGRVGIVVLVRHGGEEAALKVSFPHDGNRSEGPALRAFGGRGAVRLHDDDPERFALLVERAGPATPAERLGTDEWIDVAAELAVELAVPADAGAPVLAATAPGWEERLDRQLADAPGIVPDAGIARARDAIHALGADRSTTRMHGDLHARNVLEASRRPWLAIDPKGYRGPIAWDGLTVCVTPLATLERHPDPATELRRRIHRFADATGIDRAWAVELAFARAVSSLLHETLGGGEAIGRRLLARTVVDGL